MGVVGDVRGDTVDGEFAALAADELAKVLASAVPTSGAWDQLAADRDQLSGSGLVDAIAAVERLTRHVHGLGLWLWGEAARRASGSPPGDGENSDCCVTAETLAAVAGISRRDAERRLALAGRLTTRHTPTVLQIERGNVRFERARSLARITARLDEETARLVEMKVLPNMPGRRPDATNKAIRRAVASIDPDGGCERQAAEQKPRGLVLRSRAGGMASVELYTTAQNAAALMAVVDSIAESGAGGDTALSEKRAVAERRADALTKVVLGHSTGGARGAAGVAGCVSTPESLTKTDAGVANGGTPAATIHVLVDLATLIGVDDKAADLLGTGAIDPATARALAFAEGSIWRRLIVNRSNGRVVEADPRTYRPNAARDHLGRAQSRHCTFPGCARPARECDSDHADSTNRRSPRAGGSTTRHNPQPLCRRHHRLKSRGFWHVDRDPATEAHVWTSHTGHQVVVPRADWNEPA